MYDISCTVQLLPKTTNHYAILLMNKKQVGSQEVGFKQRALQTGWCLPGRRQGMDLVQAAFYIKGQMPCLHGVSFRWSAVVMQRELSMGGEKQTILKRRRMEKSESFHRHWTLHWPIQQSGMSWKKKQTKAGDDRIMVRIVEKKQNNNYWHNWEPSHGRSKGKTSGAKNVAAVAQELTRIELTLPFRYF